MELNKGQAWKTSFWRLKYNLEYETRMEVHLRGGKLSNLFYSTIERFTVYQYASKARSKSSPKSILEDVAR